MKEKTLNIKTFLQSKLKNDKQIIFAWNCDNGKSIYICNGFYFEGVEKGNLKGFKKLLEYKKININNEDIEALKNGDLTPIDLLDDIFKKENTLYFKIEFGKIEDLNEIEEDQENENFKEKDNKYNLLINLFRALENATELNDIEAINILNNLIVDRLPFKDEKEKNKYLDFIATFTDWEEYKKATFKIMNHIYK